MSALKLERLGKHDLHPLSPETPPRVKMFEDSKDSVPKPVVAPMSSVAKVLATEVFARTEQADDINNAMIKIEQDHEQLEEVLRTAATDYPELETLVTETRNAYVAIKLVIQENAAKGKVHVDADADQEGLKTKINLCAQLMNRYHSLSKSHADSIFMQKAIGIALIVLGGLMALLGALTSAVGLGAITTVQLAPLGAIGVKAGAGLVGTGIATMAAGVGFFVRGCQSNTKTTEPVTAAEPPALV